MQNCDATIGKNCSIGMGSTKKEQIFDANMAAKWGILPRLVTSW